MEGNPDQGFTEASDGPPAPGCAPAGAPEPGGPEEGGAASGLAGGGVPAGGVLAGGVVVADGLAAGVPAGDGFAAGVVAGRGPNSTLLCLGASGSTSGPFWPHPTSRPAAQRPSHTCRIFMIRVYRLPQ